MYLYWLLAPFLKKNIAGNGFGLNEGFLKLSDGK